MRSRSRRKGSRGSSSCGSSSLRTYLRSVHGAANGVAQAASGPAASREEKLGWLVDPFAFPTSCTRGATPTLLRAPAACTSPSERFVDDSSVSAAFRRGSKARVRSRRPTDGWLVHTMRRASRPVKGHEPYERQKPTHPHLAKPADPAVPVLVRAAHRPASPSSTTPAHLPGGPSTRTEPASSLRSPAAPHVVGVNKTHRPPIQLDAQCPQPFRGRLTGQPQRRKGRKLSCAARASSA